MLCWFVSHFSLVIKCAQWYTLQCRMSFLIELIRPVSRSFSKFSYYFYSDISCTKFRWPSPIAALRYEGTDLISKTELIFGVRQRLYKNRSHNGRNRNDASRVPRIGTLELPRLFRADDVVPSAPLSGLALSALFGELSRNSNCVNIVPPIM